MTRSGSLALSLLSLACLSLVSTAQAQNLVQDPGFENATPSAPSAPYTGSIGDGWTVTQGVVYIGTSGFQGVPRTGSQYAYLGGGNTPNTLSQTINTIVGTQYTFSFYAVDDSPNPFSASFGAQTVYNGTAPARDPFNASTYQLFTYNVTAASASTNIAFTGAYTQTFSNGTQLDDVSVTQVTAVPEPGSIALLVGAGAVGAAFLRRRKIARQAA